MTRAERLALGWYTVCFCVALPFAAAYVLGREAWRMWRYSPSVEYRGRAEQEADNCRRGMGEDER